MAEQNFCDFWTRYSNLCLKCKVCPSKSVLKNMKKTTLCCAVERIRSEHWQFLLSALSIDSNLKEVCFKSHLPSLEDQKELWKKRSRRRNENYPVPYGYSPHNISEICKHAARLLLVSRALQVLVFENLPITKEDAGHLAEGLKESSIKEFSLRCFPYPDEVINIVCRGLWNSVVSSLDFSACNLSFDSLQNICNIIKKFKDRRSIEIFPFTLRGEKPSLEIIGLQRLTLSGNNIGDKGVELICEVLSDDPQLQALDLQYCGITNDGANILAKLTKSNRTLQLIDLRLNNVDENVIEKISSHLLLNQTGKIINHVLQPLWKPHLLSKTVPVRRSKLKTKVKKKYTKPRLFQREIKSSGVINPKKVNTKDSSVQTVQNSCVKDLQEMVRKLNHRLQKEARQRESVENVMQEIRTENLYLRQEVNKLSTFEDVILIDQETYSEIKHVFEKFQRFLKLMKDLGLWELVVNIGVSDYENTKLKAVPSESKVCIVEKDQQPHESYPTNGPSVIPKQQTRGCSCGKPDCISNQKAENHKLNANYCQKAPQDKSQVKNADKTRIKKVFDELRETYNNSDSSKQSSTGPPPAHRNPYNEPVFSMKPTHISRNYPNKAAYHADITRKLNQVETREQIFDVIRDELERQGSNCNCQVHRNLHFPANAHSQMKDQKNVNSNSHNFNILVPDSVGSVAKKKLQRANAYVVSGNSPIISQTFGHSASNNSVKNTLLSDGYSSTSLKQNAHLVPNEWSDHVKMNFPELNTKQELSVEAPLNPILVDPEYFKIGTSPGKPETEQELDLSTTSKHRIPNQEASSTSDQTVSKTPSDFGDKVFSDSRTSYEEANSVSIQAIPETLSNLSEKKASYKRIPKQDLISTSTQTISKTPSDFGDKKASSPLSSFVNSVSEQEIKNMSFKNDQMKSYLESVSDASTDKDVNSLPEIEVFNPCSKSDSDTLKNSNKSLKRDQTAVGDDNPNYANSAVSNSSKSNNSKSSRKNQKHKRSNQKSSGGKELKENASSSSVPSLSDITTVSSHSLNTDSVMGQLSESEKGIS